MPEADEKQFIPSIILNQDEILINSITADINGDSWDDQISAIKRGNSPDIILLVFLNDIKTGQYMRAAEIKTEISQANTFSFYMMDVTGKHVNALVYSGITNGNETVLKVFQPSWTDGFALNLIADLKSDGTVFIQEIYRSDAYSFGMTTGESFPIWTYSSDPDAGPQTLDQIHTQYNWNEQAGLYEKTSEMKIPGKRIEAKELQRIQDGTTETFENFLEGLWYKPSSTEHTQYLFFSPKDKEIIFQVDNTQEIYDWNSSTLRRNGIYLSTSNKSISTLRRRFDITLSALDEIKLKLSEDVQMIINTESQWDGIYKKMPVTITETKAEHISSAAISSVLQGNGGWVSPNGLSLSFTPERYTVESSRGTDTGMYGIMQVGEKTVIQFRSVTDIKMFDGYYGIYVSEEPETEKTLITMIPVTISLTGTEAVPGETFQFEQQEPAG